MSAGSRNSLKGEGRKCTSNKVLAVRKRRGGGTAVVMSVEKPGKWSIGRLLHNLFHPFESDYVDGDEVRIKKTIRGGCSYGGCVILSYVAFLN